MLNNKTVAVVITAYNEEKLIKQVIEGIPDFVDRIVVVNDFSKDSTLKIVKECLKNDNRLITKLNHTKPGSEADTIELIW